MGTCTKRFTLLETYHPSCPLHHLGDLEHMNTSDRGTGTKKSPHICYVHIVVYTASLVAGHELGGVVPSVGCERISDVLGPVLDRALARDDSLDVEAEHGEHSEAAVLELLNLELSKGVGVVSEAKGVEGLTGVQWVKSLASGATVYAVSLNQAHEDHLHNSMGKGVEEYCDGERLLGITIASSRRFRTRDITM